MAKYWAKLTTPNGKQWSPPPCTTDFLWKCYGYAPSVAGNAIEATVMVLVNAADYGHFEDRIRAAFGENCHVTWASPKAYDWTPPATAEFDVVPADDRQKELVL